MQQQQQQIAYIPPMQKAPREVLVIPQVQQAKIQSITRQLRVAAYCRVSTDKEEQLTSYESQKNYYTQLIMQNKEWHMAGIMADEGLTGTSAKKRPEFLKLIRMCRRKQVDIILTKSISRFARNTVDCLKYVRELKALGIAVIFEKENLNTLKMESELLITMLGGFAQAESESISANVSWGKRNSLKNGNVNFPYSRMYGYRKGEDGEPEIILEQAEVVQRIYQQYLDGMSIGKIIKMLDEDAIAATSKTGEWSPGKIEYLLKNEKYCGDCLGQKTFISDPISKKIIRNDGQLPKVLVKNNHAAIISHELFDAVQAERARRSGKRKISDKTSKTEQSKYCSKYALSELLICGDCGTPYKRVTWSKRGNKKIVWRCISRIDYGTKYCHSSPTIEENRLHDAIVRCIQSLSIDSGHKVDIIRQNVLDVMNQTSDSRGEVEQRIREINGATTQLVKHMTADRIAGNTDIDYDSQFATLTTELQTLQATLQTLMDAAGPRKQNHYLDEMLALLGELPLELTEYDDNLARRLIDGVKVVDAERIVVVFKDGREVEQSL